MDELFDKHTFREMRDNGEFIQTSFNHLDLPENLSAPVINGVGRTMNLGVQRAPGWHYEPESIMFLPSYRKVVGQSLSFRITTANKKGEPNRAGILFEFSKNRSFASKIPLADIFKVVFNITDAEQIQALVGSSSELLTSKYLKEKSNSELVRSIKYKKLPNDADMTHKLRIMMTTQTMIESPVRVYDLLGLHNFIGMTLGEEIYVNGRIFEENTVLDANTAFDLEHSGISSILLLTKDMKKLELTLLPEMYVRTDSQKINGEIRKFKELEGSINEFEFNNTTYVKEGTPETNTLAMYCVVINRLLAFNIAGITFSMQDYKNQRIITFEDKIDDFIRADLVEVAGKVAAAQNLLEGVNLPPFDTTRARKLITDDTSLAVITKNENPLAITSQGNTLVRDVERLAQDAIKVQAQDLGVIDPVDTAESKQIGKSTALTLTTEVDDNGIMVTPLYKVVDGVVTKEVEMVKVGDSEALIVAEEGSKLEGNVLARHQGSTKLFDSSLVTHVRVSPFSSTSACRGSAVFIEHTDAKRTQMTANSQKQARTVARPSRPRVETGVESIVANGDTGVKFFFTVEDLFERVNINPALLKDKYFELTLLSEEGVTKNFKLTCVEDENLFALFEMQMEKSSNGSAYYYELVASKADGNMYTSNEIVYKQHNILIDNANLVEGSDRLDYHTKGKEDYFGITTANGQDLFVMYGFNDSYTVDDAITISDRVVRDLSLSTPVMVTKKYKKKKHFSANNKEERYGVPDGAMPDGYTDSGLPVLGSYLRPGSIWLYKYDDDLETRQVDIKNLSLTQDQYGEVVAIEENDLEVKVTLMKWNHVEVGDKVGGRHGNKAILSRVAPAESMPYHPESGRHIDIIINPLSTPSRGNISQLAEMQKSAEVELSDKQTAIVPPFSNQLMDMVENYEENKDATELQFIDSRTGLYYPKKHFAGYMHYIRNYKISEEQLHAIGDSNDMDIAFKQPVGGDSGDKGQSISSMEKELLVSYGAEGILDEIHSILSADIDGFREINDIIQKQGSPIDGVEYKGKNEHANHMQHVALAFHASLTQDEDGIKMQYMSDADMESFQLVDPYSLQESLMDRKYLNTMMAIDLQTKFITPVAIKKYNFASLIKLQKYDYKGETTKGYFSEKAIEGLINQSLVLSVLESSESITPVISIYPADINKAVLEEALAGNVPEMITGMSAVVHILETYPVDLWIRQLEEHNPEMVNTEGIFDEDLAKRLNKAKAVKCNGGFDRFITTKFPVLPNKYRQSKDEYSNSSTFTHGYKSIAMTAPNLEGNDSQKAELYKTLTSLMLPGDSSKFRISLYEFMSKKDLGGKMRTNILKTRIKLSMRGTIVPMFNGDPAKYGYPEFAGHPDSIGLPLIGAIEVAQPHVVAFLKANYDYLIADCETGIEATSKVIDILTLPISAAINLTPWDISEIHEKVKTLEEELITLINGRYVFYGRAPSLQETSARGGRVYVHKEKVVHLHSLLTTDLNADHDGDQIYIAMPLTAAAINDIKTKMLPSVNALRYNDGLPSLAISQDSLLGLFLATKQPDLTKSSVFVKSIEHIDYLLSLGDLGINDNVIMTYGTQFIKSTAGLIMVNDIICKYSDDKYVEGKDGYLTPKHTETISGSGGGEEGISISDLQMEVATVNNDGVEITNIYSQLQSFGYRVCDMVNVTLGIKDLTPVLLVDSINDKVKGYVETARTLDELGMLPEDYLVDLSGKVHELMDELDIMSKVPDDNTFKLLAVSGAKGKKSSIERMFGVVGFVDGNDGNKLETPILSNTVRGLSQFQSEDMAYTQRDNAISTVFETSKPGEALRSGAFAMSGMIIQESVEEEKVEQLVLYEPDYSYRYVLGTDIESAFVYEGEEGYKHRGEVVTMESLIQIFESSIQSIPLDGQEGLRIFKTPYVKVAIGDTKENAVYIEEDESESYRGEELHYDLVRQLSNSRLPYVTLDSGRKLFIDSKVNKFALQYLHNRSDFDGLKVTDGQLKDILKDSPTHIPLASHTNEFSVETGISSRHAGYRMGVESKYRIGENIGIKASTAAAQPANQLVISKRNMDRASGLDNGIDNFKKAIQSSVFFNGETTMYELLAPEDGVITYSLESQGTLIQLTGMSGLVYTHRIPAENEDLLDMKVQSGDIVFLGQTIYAPSHAGEDRLVSPIKSFTWDETAVPTLTGVITYREKLINPSTDLVQLIRYYFMIYLEAIYRVNNISLDANHYGAFALQASRFAKVLRSKSRDVGYLNLVTYFGEEAEDEDEVVEMVLTSASMTIMLTAGPIASLAYRDSITTVANASLIGSLPENGPLGKIALGVSIRSELPKDILQEQKIKKRALIKVQDEVSDEIKLEQEEAMNDSIDDLFGFGDLAPEDDTDKDSVTVTESHIALDSSSLFGFSDEKDDKEDEEDISTESHIHNLTQTNFFSGGTEND